MTKTLSLWIFVAVAYISFVQKYIIWNFALQIVKEKN